MSGSNQQSKTSKTVENQLPLKGHTGAWIDPKTGLEMHIEGLGDGRYRIHAKKGLKTSK